MQNKPQETDDFPIDDLSSEEASYLRMIHSTMRD
jgi:hypothetical protein